MISLNIWNTCFWYLDEINKKLLLFYQHLGKIKSGHSQWCPWNTWHSDIIRKCNRCHKLISNWLSIMNRKTPHVGLLQKWVFKHCCTNVCFLPSLHGDCGQLERLEAEQEQLNSSLLALTTHFAQVQFRLKQIVSADEDQKEVFTNCACCSNPKNIMDSICNKWLILE